MNMGTIFFIALCAVLATVIVLELIRLTFPVLKKLIKERREKKARQKVAFGDTRKIIDKNAKEILNSAPKMTMDDLEKMCEDTPYFVVDFDSESEQLTSEFQGIKPKAVGQDVQRLLDEEAEDGIVLFD